MRAEITPTSPPMVAPIADVHQWLQIDPIQSYILPKSELDLKKEGLGQPAVSKEIEDMKKQMESMQSELRELKELIEEGDKE